MPQQNQQWKFNKPHFPQSQLFRNFNQPQSTKNSWRYQNQNRQSVQMPRFDNTTRQTNTLAQGRKVHLTPSEPMDISSGNLKRIPFKNQLYQHQMNNTAKSVNADTEEDEIYNL